MRRGTLVVYSSTRPAGMARGPRASMLQPIMPQNAATPSTTRAKMNRARRCWRSWLLICIERWRNIVSAYVRYGDHAFARAVVVVEVIGAEDRLEFVASPSQQMLQF